MEGMMKGDRRISSWHYPSNPAPRPPKSPSFQSAGCPPLEKTDSYIGHKKLPHSTGLKQHQRSPSASFAVEQQFSWLDDLLDDSKSLSTNKSSHRRSASDSFTFIESSDALYKISDIAEEEEFDCNGVGLRQTRDFTESDHSEISNVGQVMSLLVEDERTHFIPSSNSNAHWKPESSTRDIQAITSIENVLMCHRDISKITSESAFQDILCALENAHDVSEEQGFLDPNGEPKQAKRHSAQRSRVRKLQYIAELENIVNSLQTAVSTLSPQVAYLEHERMGLIMENNYLKKRIALFSNQKNAKDAQYKALMNEVQMWRKSYQYQLQEYRQPEKTGVQCRGQDHQRHHKSLSLPSNLDVASEELSMLSLNTYKSGELMPASASSGFINHAGMASRGPNLSTGVSCNITRMTNTFVPGSKTFEDKLLSRGGLEFMVQNM